MSLPRKYEAMIPRAERDHLEQGLGMESGYVLDFSDRTFNDFFYETVGIDPEEKKNLFNSRGTSKAKRLRSFIERGELATVAKVLRELWEYRDSLVMPPRVQNEENTRESFFSTVARIEGRSDAIDTSAIESFEPNETLEELVASIKRDMDAKKPQAGIDRLHTYCMKRFASLVKKHGGVECGHDDPLHSRVGKYVALLKANRNLSPMSERIVKSSISVFEAMNPLRNDKSFAHDNPDLVEMEEARFIFDSVTAFLRYSKAIDGRHFED
ncbi:abortive infection family protein [uncultured Roseibium sp.]|uniref:abortive infection family protein n=1 Tax=uncultured Roseibium sp. TaxID=1936171 RepID=UPI0026362E76|nr:abortive infection family protein [uncultured Roseibium sp.]